MMYSACLGIQVDGEVPCGFGDESTVGSTFQVSVGLNHTISEKLSPGEPGLCML